MNFLLILEYLFFVTKTYNYVMLQQLAYNLFFDLTYTADTVDLSNLMK